MVKEGAITDGFTTRGVAPLQIKKTFSMRRHHCFGRVARMLLHPCPRLHRPHAAPPVPIHASTPTLPCREVEAAREEGSRRTEGKEGSGVGGEGIREGTAGRVGGENLIYMKLVHCRLSTDTTFEVDRHHVF